METVTLEQMVAVVEDYIFERKRVRVRINMHCHPIFFQDQLNKLNYCYTVALEWNKNNPV
jgi:hypothetical protein